MPAGHRFPQASLSMLNFNDPVGGGSQIFHLLYIGDINLDFEFSLQIFFLNDSQSIGLK